METATVSRAPRRARVAATPKCPNCGESVPDLDGLPASFCPHCGYRMGSVIDEDDGEADALDFEPSHRGRISLDDLPYEHDDFE